MLALLLLTFFICFYSFEQTKKSMHISFIGRYDRHANYVLNLAGRAYNNTNKSYRFNCTGLSLDFGKRLYFKQIKAFLLAKTGAG